MTYCPLCHKSLCAREKRVMSKVRFNYKSRRRGNHGVGPGGPTMRTSPRKTMSSKADKEGKTLSVVSSACGHLFHQACIHEYIHQNRTTGEGFGSTYVVNCPLCQMSISNSKMLKVDVDAHVGILDDFFHDLYKLKYMNDELKQTLEAEWADIADIDNEIEARNDCYKKLCKEKSKRLSDIKRQEEKITKVIEDASTCYRYREIEKQLLDENTNLQAVVRRMETILENRVANDVDAGNSLESSDASTTLIHDVNESSQSSDRALVLKSDEGDFRPFMDHDKSLSAKTGVNYEISVEKQWSLVIEESGSTGNCQWLSNEYLDAISGNSDDNLMLVPAGRNFNDDSRILTTDTCAARVGTNATTILSSSVEALRYPLPEELYSTCRASNEHGLEPDVKELKSQVLSTSGKHQVLLRSKACEIFPELTENTSNEERTRPRTVTKLCGNNRLRLRFHGMASLPIETTDEGHTMHANTTDDDYACNAEFKLTRSISYVIKRWQREESRIFELEDKDESERGDTAKVKGPQENKPSLGILANINLTDASLNQESRKRKIGGRMREKLIAVTAKKSLMMINALTNNQTTRAGRICNDLKAGTVESRLTIDLRGLHYSINASGLSQRFLRSSLMSAPSGTGNKGQEFPEREKYSKTPSMYSMLAYGTEKDTRIEKASKIGSFGLNSKSWTRILRIAEAHQNDIVSLSNGNLRPSSLSRKDVDTKSNSATSSLLNINDLIIKPPPEDEYSTQNICDLIRIVPPPPSTFEREIQLRTNNVTNKTLSEYSGTMDEPGMTWMNPSLAEVSKEARRREESDQCQVSLEMELNKGAGDNCFSAATPFTTIPIQALTSVIYCLNDCAESTRDDVNGGNHDATATDCMAAERFTSELSSAALTSNSNSDYLALTSDYCHNGTVNYDCAGSHMVWNPSPIHQNDRSLNVIPQELSVEGVQITDFNDYNLIWNNWTAVSTPIVLEEPASSGESEDELNHAYYYDN